jgi:hypothetical protein
VDTLKVITGNGARNALGSPIEFKHTCTAHMLSAALPESPLRKC